MSKRANTTAIGAFVLVAAALAVTAILALGGLRLFSDETSAVAFFDGDVGGLVAGSPVLLRGAPVGRVSRIEIALDPQHRIAVYMKIAPKRQPHGAAPIRTQKDLQPLIDRGLRARLAIVSFVTGQLSVSLDFLPDTPVVLSGLAPGTPELPTIPTQLQQLQARIDRILASLDRADVAQLAEDVGKTVRSVGDLARSPELAAAIRNARDAFHAADTAIGVVNTQVSSVGSRAGVTLDAARELVQKVDREIEPLATSVRTAFDSTRELVGKVDREIEPLASSVRTTFDATHELVSKADREVEPLAVSARRMLDAVRTAAESAQGTLRTVNRTLDGDTRLGDDLSQTLQQLTAAARSLSALADYLEQHPEALLLGKQAADAR